MLKALCLFFFFVIGLHSSSIRAQQNVEDSLNKIISLGKNDADVAKAYSGLAYEFSRKDPVKSRDYTNRAIAIGKKLNDTRRLSTSYLQLVYLFHDVGKADSAEYYLNMAKNLVTEASEKDKDAVSSNYFSGAALYYRRTGNSQKAIPFFEKAIIVLTRIGDRESVAGQTLNLGNAYLSLGNYQKATEQHIKALRIFDELNNDRGRSFCYQSLSNSFTQLKQYKQALLYSTQSIQLKTAINDRKGLGSAESGLGDIYFGLGDFDKALYHYNAGLNIAREMKQFPEEQANYFSIAKVHVAKKEVKKAIEYFNLSKLLAKQLHDSTSVASIDAQLISLQYNVEKTEVSENKLKTSLQLFEQLGDLNRQASGFKNMEEFYVANKQFDKALEYNNKYYGTLDSIRNNELQLQVKKMEELYNVEKKEKEITILKKDQLLSQASLQKQRIFQYVAILFIVLLTLIGFLVFNRNKLRVKMKELALRNRIAADLHDEVGSSLSSIHMLSQMAAHDNNDITHKDLLKRMSNNAKETMDKMGDIVWMIKPGETEAGSLKQRMERFAYEICSSKNIDVSMQLEALEKIKLTMEQRKNIYLVFKEALNNAVKYSGTEKIEISAGFENKELTMMVKDEGAGFDSNRIKKGNGLDNMQSRANEMKGDLKILTEPGKGTAVLLTLTL